MTLIHDALPTEDLAWKLAWPQSFSELEIRGPGFNIPSLIRHWLWTALKGSTTLSKAVFFSYLQKNLKLRLSCATLSTTRKKNPEFLREHLGGASQLHKNWGRVGGNLKSFSRNLVLKTNSVTLGSCIKYSSLLFIMGFPGGSEGSHLQCGRPGFDPWVGKIPWRRAWQPTSVFWLGESPWTEEPGGLQSTGSHRVRHNWVTKWKWKLLSPVRLFVTPWTIQSMEFSRPEYWSG